MLLLNVLFVLRFSALLNGGIMKVNYSISKIPPNLPLQREAYRYIAILATSLH